MHAEIRTVKEPELRVKIVEQRADFDLNPIKFRENYNDSQQILRNKIIKARESLKKVNLDYEFRIKISQICSELNVDGLRGDIVTNRASKALTAFEGRTEVTAQDIFRVIPLCLRHRLRKDPLETIDSGDKVRDIFKKIFN